MWVKRSAFLVDALSVTPDILRSKEYERGQVSDFRDWQVWLRTQAATALLTDNRYSRGRFCRQTGVAIGRSKYVSATSLTYKSVAFFSEKPCRLRRSSLFSLYCGDGVSTLNISYSPIVLFVSVSTLKPSHREITFVLASVDVLVDVMFGYSAYSGVNTPLFPLSKQLLYSSVHSRKIKNSPFCSCKKKKV